MFSLSPFKDNDTIIIVLAFVIINAAFLLFVPLYPFVDLPNHLSEAYIYKNYDTPGYVIADYYRPTPWYYPNTFHTVFCSLFPSVELGNKIFHILYIVLLQGSLYLIIKELKGNLWYGLLGFLFTYNYNLTYGFVGFAISIPTLLILFYVILLDIKLEKVSLKIIISLLLVILFLMHAQNALFGLLLYGLMMLYRYYQSFTKLLIRGLLIPLPLVVMIFTWWFTRGSAKEQSTTGFLLDYYSSTYFKEFIDRFKIVALDNNALADGAAGYIIAFAFFATLLIPFLYIKPWKNNNWRLYLNKETVYPFILFAASLLCYLFLPDELPGQAPLYQRFCTIVILSFIILGSIWFSSLKFAALKYVALFTMFVYTCFWFEHIYTFNDFNKNFNADFFSKGDKRARLAGLIYDNSYRGRRVYIHFPNYFLVWDKGVVASKIIDYRFGVVQRVASESTIPFYHELIGENHGERPKPSYSNLEYVLVRGKGLIEEDINITNFELQNQAGLWQLYENKRKVVTDTVAIKNVVRQ